MELTKPVNTDEEMTTRHSGGGGAGYNRKDAYIHWSVARNWNIILVDINRGEKERTSDPDD